MDDIHNPPPRRASRRASLTGMAPNLEPAGQGDFDGLCGLYSTINALRLLLAINGSQLGVEKCERLFRTGVEYLDRQDRLVRAAYWGIGPSVWRKLSDRLVRKAGQMSGLGITIDRPFAPRQPADPASVYSAIAHAVARQRPVLVLLNRTYGHYTVISAVTDARFILFDSYGFRWIERASCNVGATNPPKRHQLAPATITILSVMEVGDGTA